MNDTTAGCSPDLTARAVRPRRQGVVVLATIALAACASGPSQVSVSPGGGIGVTRGPLFGWEIKRVATKAPPDTLVAEDGTVCRVTPERYAETAPGARLECDWQPGAPVAEEPPEGAEQDL